MIVSGKVKTEIKEEKKKMMLKQMMIKHHQVHEKKVLLTDEVDVFFGNEFCGNCYAPAVTIREPRIKRTTDYICSNKCIDIHKYFVVNKLRDLMRHDNINILCLIIIVQE